MENNSWLDSYPKKKIILRRNCNSRQNLSRCNLHVRAGCKRARESEASRWGEQSKRRKPSFRVAGERFSVV